MTKTSFSESILLSLGCASAWLNDEENWISIGALILLLWPIPVACAILGGALHGGSYLLFAVFAAIASGYYWWLAKIYR